MMNHKKSESIEHLLVDIQPNFKYWEKTKDIIDQLIDIILNYRQSGHPGGSRSKNHALLTLMLSGVMKWDIRFPENRFGDRFILGAGHTIPLVYCSLAVLNEAFRIKYQQTKNPIYKMRRPDKHVLYWEDLLGFRRINGLSGHAEMEGKTLFLKSNTGPSGHGGPMAAGQALTLKRAGANEVKVFVLEGEAALTSGATHEVLNSAWGLALDNLYFLVDWNDYGIDNHKVSDVVYGNPDTWFSSHGWQVFGTENGSDWKSIAHTFLSMNNENNPTKAPSVIWMKTRKGREYLKYDNKSHGSPHAINSTLFWDTKRPFMEKYDVQFHNFGGEAPSNDDELRKEFSKNLEAVINVLHKDQKLVDYLTETLISIADSIPQNIPTYKLSPAKTPFEDPKLFDYKNYPPDIYVEPGTKIANRAALAKWGAWINAYAAKEYNRPIFIVSSADLAGSTNISGFAEGYKDFPGYGVYERYGTDQGVLLPQEITEFVNASIATGMASVNLSTNPENTFDGFWTACSTYGSFSYLKYGLMRLFSQMAQDCQLKMGKVLWIAGHSGPETADDSRTHFGIFSPGVTQLFPKGQIINIHPWEYNEVPVLLGEALKQDVPIVALHLTRPPISIPDRKTLGIPSHFDAARGAYIVRDYKKDQAKGGTVIVQGTSAMANIINILPWLDEHNLNVKIVCATSAELFNLQSKEYQEKTITPADRIDSMAITTQARWLMHDWHFTKTSEEYSLSSDWDNRWRTGGTLNEIIEEAHLSPDWLFKGITKFVKDRKQRLDRLGNNLEQARK